MRIPIPCNKQPFRLTMGIRAFEPTHLALRGANQYHGHSNYVMRWVPFKANAFERGSCYKEINIPFPISPEQMLFSTTDAYRPFANTFRIEKFEVTPLEERPLWEHPNTHRFIPFANWFSERAGFLETGYYDHGNEFLIHYLPVIRDEFNKPLITPARTSRNTGRQQLSRHHIQPLSIPIRWFILMHELKHFQLPTRDEVEADLAALRVFLDYGFPKVEAIYASYIAMEAHTEMAKKVKAERLRELHAFIDNYITKNNAKEIVKSA